MQYKGTLDGKPAIMVALLDGTLWRARVEVGGGMYALEGSVVGDQVQGLAQDLATGEQAPLLAQLDQDGVSVVLPVEGRLDLVETGSSAAEPVEEPVEDGGDDVGSVDAGLVGEWLWTDSSTGPGLGIVLQERLVLRADGTFAYGDAKVAGGGDGASLSSGAGAGYQTGRWRTDGSWVYLHTGSGFQQYARYSTNGASLLLQFMDGSRRLWSRAGG